MAENKTDIKVDMQKLAAKMNEEFAMERPYEAMMYVQTFVARKRKQLSNQNTCSLVYCGIKILQQHAEWGDAGVLLDWLLSSGSLDLDPSNSNFDEIAAIISSMPKEGAIVFLDATYKPLCGYIQKCDGAIKHRYMFQLSLLCGEIFEHCRRWRDAKNCYIGVGDMSSLVRVIHLWSADGFPSEYSLFFVRTYLFLLANQLVPQAAAFFKAAEDEYLEPYELTLSCQPHTPLRTACTKSFALWQMCTMISDMMTLADNPLLSLKVDRKQVFTLLLDKYEPLLKYHDDGLLPAMQEVASSLFGVVNDKPAPARNPMQSILQNLMGGGEGGGKRQSGMSK